MFTRNASYGTSCVFLSRVSVTKYCIDSKQISLNAAKLGIHEQKSNTPITLNRFYAAMHIRGRLYLWRRICGSLQMQRMFCFAAQYCRGHLIFPHFDGQQQFSSIFQRFEPVLIKILILTHRYLYSGGKKLQKRPRSYTIVIVQYFLVLAFSYSPKSFVFLFQWFTHHSTFRSKSICKLVS